MTELTQEQKLALRLKSLIETSGLHEIQIYVTPEKVVQFWVVKTDRVEGEKPVVETDN